MDGFMNVTVILYEPFSLACTKGFVVSRRDIKITKADFMYIVKAKTYVFSAYTAPLREFVLS